MGQPRKKNKGKPMNYTSSPTRHRRALYDLLQFTNNNLETATLFKQLFEATFEYLQFLINNRSQAIALHTMVRKIQQHGAVAYMNHHKQYSCLNEFHELYCQLAEAIENDYSGDWGDISPPSYSREYEKRKMNFESKMDVEWKKAQETLNQNDVQFYWTLN